MAYVELLVEYKQASAMLILDSLKIEKSNNSTSLICYFMFIAIKGSSIIISAWALQKAGKFKESLDGLDESFEYLSTINLDLITLDSLVLNYWIETVMFTHVMTLCSLSY